MHEHALIADLVRKIETVARAHGARKVRKARLVLGALSHLSVEHLREHFVEAARGTLAEGAALEARLDSDLGAPHAQGILLEAVEVED
jgi:hydrogenase nickel incorporation protein HypA/HybF